MKRYYLGIDTSCYTTSCAIIDSDFHIVGEAPYAGEVAGVLREVAFRVEHHHVKKQLPVFDGGCAVACVERSRGAAVGRARLACYVIAAVVYRRGELGRWLGLVLGYIFRPRYQYAAAVGFLLLFGQRGYGR